MNENCQDVLEMHTELDIEGHEESVDDVDTEVNLLHIPWEDILMKYIMPCLSIPDCFRLRAVSSCAKELVTFYFSRMKFVNVCQLAMTMIPAAFNIMTCDNSRLERLMLRNARDWLSNALIIPVLRNNHNLRRVDFSNCTTVNNSCLQVLAVSCRDLRELYLWECHWVSVEGIHVIALNCVNLERLDLTGCWEVNNSAVIRISENCSKLRYLSVAKIYGLTDCAISELAKNLQCIYHLNIQGCWRLTDDSIRDLAEYNHSLRALQVRECRDVREGSLSRLRHKGVKIDILPPPQLRGLSSLRHRPNVQI